MNKILKEVFHDEKRFYNDEERITINYHREMYLNLKGCPWWENVRKMTDDGWKKKKEKEQEERELEEQDYLRRMGDLHRVINEVILEEEKKNKGVSWN
jgi:hypothetical protein